MTGSTEQGTASADDGALRVGAHPTHRTWWRRRRVWLPVAVLAVVVLGPVLAVQATGQAKVRSSVAAVDATPVAIVLGAGLRPDGSPSTFLTRRLARAAEIYAAGTVQAVLVSGDNSREDYDEPTAMHDWLVANGVPAAKVVRDYAGFDTHDTCRRARRVFGVEAAVVVTQDYHVRRAAFSCAAAGIDVQGSGVSSASVEPSKAVMYRVRELPASWKAALDAVVNRSPVYLGDPEPGVRDALAG